MIMEPIVDRHLPTLPVLLLPPPESKRPAPDESPASSRVVAFVDIGTNSIRLLLVRINSNHSFSTITQQKQVVRLGEDEATDQVLQPAAMERAVLVCRKFAELAQLQGAQETIAVATSATRQAKNQKEFLRRLRHEAGLDVRVISGKEEARLIYLGISSGVDLGDRQALFIDIGGGSTEIIVGDQRQYHYLSSLNLGAVHLGNLFFMANESQPVSPERYAKMQRHIRDAAVRTVQEVRGYDVDLGFGSSGTIENLTDIAARTIHNRMRKPDDCLTHADLKQVMQMLCALPLEQRRQVPGINPERADIIIAGGAIVDTLMQDWKLKELRVISERGLREGLLIDYLARSEHSHLVRKLSVRERSVVQLARACRCDERHARRVVRLALELFDSAQKEHLHHFDSGTRELLKYAAWLHDIGALLSYNNHHVHTYYLIRNADLVGFDQAELGVMAATAFFHRRGIPGKKYPEYRELDKRSRKIVKLLAMLLRLAELLDRSHTGPIKHARLHASGRKNMVLEIQALQDCHLELWGIQDRARAIEKTLGRTLHVKVIKARATKTT
jgi:exopolyphosphatase / guanosine-5'-triphosphate,3'-diphosphate pyrophosphatase